VPQGQQLRGLGVLIAGQRRQPAEHLHRHPDTRYSNRTNTNPIITYPDTDPAQHRATTLARRRAPDKPARHRPRIAFSRPPQGSYRSTTHQSRLWRDRPWRGLLIADYGEYGGHPRRALARAFAGNLHRLLAPVFRLLLIKAGWLLIDLWWAVWCPVDVMKARPSGRVAPSAFVGAWCLGSGDRSWQRGEVGERGGQFCCPWPCLRDA
jgi:hypothetical protein